MCCEQQGADGEAALVGHEPLQLIVFGGGPNGPTGVQHPLFKHVHLQKQTTQMG